MNLKQIETRTRKNPKTGRVEHAWRARGVNGKIIAHGGQWYSRYRDMVDAMSAVTDAGVRSIIVVPVKR